MSVFRLTAYQIGVVVGARAVIERDRYQVNRPTASHIQDMVNLDQANRDSINARYALCGEDQFGVLTPHPPEILWCAFEYAYNVRRGHYRLTPVEAIKAALCIDYQNDEAPNYINSPAERFIRHAIPIFIGMLDGYDAAEWSLEKPDDYARTEDKTSRDLAATVGGWAPPLCDKTNDDDDDDSHRLTRTNTR